MKLREWKQMSSGGQQVSTTSSGSSNNSFKKRFNKLIDYYGQHLPKEVSYLDVGLTTKDTLAFSEVYKKGDKINFKISITDFDDESWIVKVDTDGYVIATLVGCGWQKLLNKLGAYIGVPQRGTPDYDDLLIEWVDKNGNKINLNNSPAPASQTINSGSSLSNKEKFKKILDFHIAAAPQSIDRKEIKFIKETGFHYMEHVRVGTSGHGYDRDVVVSIDDKNNWYLTLYKDGSTLRETSGSGFNALVETLEFYLILPYTNTPEYQELLESSSMADDFKLYEDLWN